MGSPVDFPGTNRHYGPPPGRDEDVGSLRVFANGTCLVSAWELTDAEIDEIVRTRRVFLSCMSDPVLVPIYVGAESVVRSVVVDYGKVWPNA